MKDLTGQAETTVGATPEETVELLEAVERYPTWYPELIRRVEVLDRDAAGVPTRARTTVHLALGPFERDLEFEVAVSVRPAAEVKLARIPHAASDQERFELTWQVQPGSATRLAVTLEARLPVPRLVPVGGIGDSMARGLVTAASRALEQPPASSG